MFKNASATRVSPRTSLGEFTALPRLPDGLKGRGGKRREETTVEGISVFWISLTFGLHKRLEIL